MKPYHHEILDNIYSRQDQYIQEIESGTLSNNSAKSITRILEKISWWRGVKLGNLVEKDLDMLGFYEWTDIGTIFLCHSQVLEDLVDDENHAEYDLCNWQYLSSVIPIIWQSTALILKNNSWIREATKSAIRNIIALYLTRFNSTVCKYDEAGISYFEEQVIGVITETLQAACDGIRYQECVLRLNLAAIWQYNCQHDDYSAEGLFKGIYFYSISQRIDASIDLKDFKLCEEVTENSCLSPIVLHAAELLDWNRICASMIDLLFSPSLMGKFKYADEAYEYFDTALKRHTAENFKNVLNEDIDDEWNN
jgi:hypothetical protein